ncbi:MAG: glycosyltransferase family 2 protein [Candidatus Delongbacteria bacterium]|nr:glycosyltransferase family 2 protein [Candidatus Delongbacteria bacterium]
MSIVTPCYNGENYLNRFLDSLVNQTYDNMEFIFVDDGSTDRTKEVLFKYKEKFEKKNIILKYFYQDNAGQAVAVANGLKHITGEYLIWPDSDDILPETSIEEKVKFLEENKKYGLVRTDGHVVNEDNLKTIVRFCSRKNKDRFKENLFEDYIICRNSWLMPGCYMLRVSALMYSNPNLYIYPSRYGQNWQIILPILYHFKCGYIDDSLFIYILRKNSHSNSFKGASYSKEKNKLHGYKDIIDNTIKNMKIQDEEKYINMTKIYYSRRLLELAFVNCVFEDAKECYQILKQAKQNTYIDFLMMSSTNNLVINKLLLLLRRTKNSIVNRD